MRPAGRTGDVLVVPIENAPQAAGLHLTEAGDVAGGNGATRLGGAATVLLRGLTLRGDIRPGG